MPGVAHDDMPGAGGNQGVREFLGVGRRGVEARKAGKSFVGRQTLAPRSRGEAQCQRPHDGSLQRAGCARRAAVACQPVGRIADQRLGAGIPARHDIEQRLTDAGQHMHVLVPVDVIGREAEALFECLELALDLTGDLVAS